MQKAIIIGGTSGIGRELAKILSEAGYVVGVTGRRLGLLEELQEELVNESFIRKMDVADADNARGIFGELVSRMGGVELVVISAGVGFLDASEDWSKEKLTIDINAVGFAAIANLAFDHFLKQGSGHLVGISSIAAIRGGAAVAYNATKAFVSNYLEGLRYLCAKSGSQITVTDIQSGFVDTAMAKGDRLFWVGSVETAAKQIYQAIRKKKKHAYVTKRWRVIAWLMKTLPDAAYHKL